MSFYYPQACMKLRIVLEDFQLTSDVTTQKPYELIVVPKDITVNINDHKTADSFSCELDYKSFPFDPRAIRACGVSIHMEDMESLVKDDGTPNLIIPSDSNAVLSGYVDDETVTFDDNNQTVKFEGRDFTALLIDQKYKENVPSFENLPLDQAISVFLNTFPATQKIKIVNKTGKTTLPTLAAYDPDFGSPQAGGRNPGIHESYWDIIQDMIRRAGLIGYIHLDTLVLNTPRNLYSPANDVKFIYGKNIKNLMMKRKLGRFKNFNIVVRSRNEKQVLQVRIPAQANPDWCKSFGINREDQLVPVLKPDGTLDNTTNRVAPAIAFNVAKVANEDALREIGQTIYEDYSRQQLEGNLETYEMVAHSGNPNDPRTFKSYDLTQLEIGQPIVIEIDTDDLNKISRLASEAERADYLIRRNYSREVAAVFAKTMGRFSPRMYTKSYSMTLSADQGFRVKLEFINIIELSNRSLTKNG